MRDLADLFGSEKPIVAVVHLPPLSPGDQEGSIEGIVERAVNEARILEEEGVEGILVENYGDFPYPAEESNPLVISLMAVVVREVVREVGLPVGVNILRNSAVSSFSVALASGGSFIWSMSVVIR